MCVCGSRGSTSWLLLKRLAQIQPDSLPFDKLRVYLERNNYQVYLHVLRFSSAKREDTLKHTVPCCRRLRRKHEQVRTRVHNESSTAISLFDLECTQRAVYGISA